MNIRNAIETVKIRASMNKKYILVFLGLTLLTFALGMNGVLADPQGPASPGTAP